MLNKPNKEMKTLNQLCLPILIHPLDHLKPFPWQLRHPPLEESDATGSNSQGSSSIQAWNRLPESFVIYRLLYRQVHESCRVQRMECQKGRRLLTRSSNSQA